MSNLKLRSDGFVQGVKETYKASSFKLKAGGCSGDIWHVERSKFIHDVLPYLRDNLFTTPTLLERF